MTTIALPIANVPRRPVNAPVYGYIAGKVYKTDSLATFNPPRDATKSVDTEELLGDANFMKAFRQGVRELDAGEGIDWDDLKAEMGL